MEIEYKVLDEIYDLIKERKKTIEVRLLNDKSRKIEKGDLIRFKNFEDKNILVKVIDKRVYKSLNLLLENEELDKIYLPKEKIKELLRDIYGEDITEVVAIEFDIMEERI